MHICSRPWAGCLGKAVHKEVRVRGQGGLGTPNAAAINDALSASATAAPHEPITRLPLSLLSDGNVYTFRLRVETHAGAQSSPVEARVRVGVDAPSVTINAPSSMLRSEPLVLAPPRLTPLAALAVSVAPYL